MSDISAVVLSLGEPYTQRAIESVAAQTAPVREIIVVERVVPFHRAINEGASRVTTSFFVQVDADMILDPACFEVLLGSVQPNTGIAVGELRDPLMGPTVGVKLFRTECFRRAIMPDSISPDTDFGERLEQLGYRTEYVETSVNGSTERPTLGEHRPDYTPSYTYRKMLLEGARLRHRAASHGLFWSIGMLENSSHPLAMFAQAAMGHGVFLPLERDELKPWDGEPRAEWLAAFLASGVRAPGEVPGAIPLDRDCRLREIFRRFLATGRFLAQSGAGATFREIFTTLSGARRDTRAMVAKVALSHGLLAEHSNDGTAARDEHAFREFIVFSLGSRATFTDRFRAHIKRLRPQRQSDARAVSW